MAAIDHSSYAPTQSAMNLGDTLFSAVHRVFRGVRVRIAARQTYNSLSSLTTRQLTDIGLEGNDIRHLSYEMAQRSIH